MTEAFNLLAVRTGEEPESELYPEPGDQPNTIEMTPQDGSGWLQFTASEMHLRQIVGDRPSERIRRIKDIKVQVFVTDARVAIACSKFDKGGGWSGWGMGGLAVAAGANAISKARAARRRKGKMLVAHVPYGVLTDVGFTEKGGFGTHNQLRIIRLDPTASGVRHLLLDIHLPRQQVGSELSQRIASKAAAYRLEHDPELGDELRRHLEALREPPRLAPAPKHFGLYSLVDPGKAASTIPATVDVGGPRR